MLAGDDEERVRHQPDQALEEPFGVAVAVAGVLEGVQQDDRDHRALGRQAADLPRQQVRVVGERLQVGVGLQEVGGAGAAGQGPGAFAAFAQCLHERGGDLSGR
ncbi:hypothetical protein [Streptomyces sp. MK37H]|uniref:hypothetical protein n=1 Tax=Streptomyces sp. MK37H TaxID=2699117 RepID=UPI001B369EE8|nr:hypothetical protein [Streptomyces sp. MK37H]MBP8534070.1 hypothetical protein [Streptomyces sp. MK37H]